MAQSRIEDLALNQFMWWRLGAFSLCSLCTDRDKTPVKPWALEPLGAVQLRGLDQSSDGGSFRSRSYVERLTDLGMFKWGQRTKENYHTCQMEERIRLFWVHIMGQNQFFLRREIAANFNSLWKTFIRTFEMVLFKNYSHFSSLFPHVWCDSNVPKGWRAWIHLCPTFQQLADILVLEVRQMCLIQVWARQRRARSEEWGRFQQ